MPPYPWNPQLPRGERSSAGAGEKRKAEAEDTWKEKKNRKLIHGAGDGGSGGGDGVLATSAEVLDGGQKAARTYQAWLEARYVDFLRALLGWVAEVDDFRLQVPDRQRALFFFNNILRESVAPRPRHHPPAVPTGCSFFRGSPKGRSGTPANTVFFD